MKLVYCVVIFVAVLQATAVNNKGEENVFPDYWQDDYDNFYDYGELNHDGSKEKHDTDKKVEAEIHDFIGNNEEPNESDSHEFDALADYQIEDNRSNADNKENADVNVDIPLEQPEEGPKLGPDNSAAEPQLEEIEKESKDDKDTDLYDEWWDELRKENNEDDVSSDLKENIELSKEIPVAVNEDSSENKEESYVEPVNEENVDPELDQAIEDVKNNLQDSDEFDSNADENDAVDNNAVGNDAVGNDVVDSDAVDNDAVGNDAADNDSVENDFDINNVENNVSDDKKSDKEDEDTPEKVLDDLSADLNKLMETLDKLSADDSDIGETDELANDGELIDSIQDYEEKYKRPHGEGYIMSLRDDYENFFSNNLTDALDEGADKSSNDDAVDADAFNDDYAEVENNGKSVELLKSVEEQDEVAAPAIDDDKSAFDPLESDETGEQLSFDDSDDDVFDDENGKHYYGNDGLVDDELPKNEDAEVFLEPASTKSSEDEPINTSKPIESVPLAAAVGDDIDISTTAADKSAAAIEDDTSVLSEASTPDREEEEEEAEEEEEVSASTKQAEINVDELNSSEYNDLMSRFAATHKNEISSASETRNIVPIHITLSVDNFTVITSPNFPLPYPTDTQVDWFIDGPGIGIEMNLTDCRINGNNGDYLLVIPGASNDESTDGIIFSFLHDSVKKYRFINVNRMFVRFKSNPSFWPLNGFSFSAKLMRPPLAITDEEDGPHESELIIQPPTETLELSLAGLTLLEFLKVKSEFEALVADMAEKYITDNNIDPGLNTTLEVTQVTRTSICNIRWPSYETCVDVSFGVPLHYAEPGDKPRLNATELEGMWRTYIGQEPFAARLRNLGITEYAIPDDHSILVIWVVIASGVVIATCLLGFALWRFNCFLDYTRMKAFSDTDSIHNEKRNLDLYPTPHQTLPPLYSENDYKWADGKFDDSARVDMGGFANKSYMRDDFFDLDSDEDVIVPHDRKTVISPRDVYEV